MNLLRRFWRFFAIALISLVLLAWGRARIEPVRKEARSDVDGARAKFEQLIGAVAADAREFGAPANIAIAERRGRHSLLQESLARLALETSWRVRDSYHIDVLGADADDEARVSFYLAHLDRMENWLAYARFWKPGFAKGGGEAFGYDFSDVSGATTGSVRQRVAFLRQKLLRLDLLERVARAARDSGVTSVEEVTILPEGSVGTFAERVPSAGRFVARQGGGTPMLRGVGLTVKARGSQRSLRAFLADLQRPEVDGMPGRALALDRFVFDRENWQDPVADVITLEATLAAFAVSIEAELPDASLEAALARETKGQEPSDTEKDAATGDGFDATDASGERRPHGRPRRGR